MCHHTWFYVILGLKSHTLRGKHSTNWATPPARPAPLYFNTHNTNKKAGQWKDPFMNTCSVDTGTDDCEHSLLPSASPGSAVQARAVLSRPGLCCPRPSSAVQADVIGICSFRCWASQSPWKHSPFPEFLFLLSRIILNYRVRITTSEHLILHERYFFFIISVHGIINQATFMLNWYFRCNFFVSPALFMLQLENI